MEAFVGGAEGGHVAPPLPGSTSVIVSSGTDRHVSRAAVRYVTCCHRRISQSQRWKRDFQLFPMPKITSFLHEAIDDTIVINSSIIINHGCKYFICQSMCSTCFFVLCFLKLMGQTQLQLPENPDFCWNRKCVLAV